MLELKNISFEVQEESEQREIIHNLDLTIEDHEFVVITGPNGGGKSTLAKLIAGIKTPTEGQIFFDGQEITGKSITERANMGISFAFQQPVRFKGLSVRDLLELSAGEKLHESTICDILGDVGLCANDYIDRDVDASLSGGESKRIEIATVLARKNVKMLVFDEPEAGIDLWSFTGLIDAFQKIKTNHCSLYLIRNVYWI